MRVDRLTLDGFRNYRRQALELDESCNVIYGENAQGKTNLLEAVVYLSCGRSPRAHGDRELIGFERQDAFVTGHIYSREREFTTEIQLFREKRRRMTVNGVPARTNAALSDVLHTVFFCPEDLFLIRAGAAERRRFMDQSLCQLRPRYAEALAEYGRLYDHKTRILRDSEEHPHLLDMLPDFNERLCRVGAVLIGYRARYCAALADYAGQAHGECSGEKEELTLTYQTVRTVTDPFGPQMDIYQALRQHMEDHAAAERASRLCLSGPHKDDLEVLVLENNSTQAETFACYGRAQQQYPNCRVLTCKGGFNFSAINNFGARHATGEHLLLLNNDIQVETPGFVRELLSYSQRPDVGAVGAKLFYPDGTIQHAGVFIGLGGSAGHSHKGHPRDSGGDMYRLATTQNMCAVTGACLMVKKELYDRFGGLDEENFAVAYNDVDFCLRLWQSGLLNVMTPFATAVHHESKSRGDDTRAGGEKQARYEREKARFCARYAGLMQQGDPYYNPHFTLLYENYGYK